MFLSTRFWCPWCDTPGGGTEAVWGVSSRSRLLPSLISLLPVHTSDTGHVLGSLSSSGKVSKVFRYKTRRTVIANHSCIRIDISCLASTHSFTQQMFIEWLQYLRPCVKHLFPLFNFLYLFHCILKLLSSSSGRVSSFQVWQDANN